jgi:hypothetical protein
MAMALQNLTMKIKAQLLWKAFKERLGTSEFS